jgi:hypothetical protein
MRRRPEPISAAGDCIEMESSKRNGGGTAASRCTQKVTRPVRQPKMVPTIRVQCRPSFRVMIEAAGSIMLSELSSSRCCCCGRPFLLPSWKEKLRRLLPASFDGCCLPEGTQELKQRKLEAPDFFIIKINYFLLFVVA